MGYGDLMDTSKIETLEQALKVIEDLNKLVKRHEKHIKVLEQQINEYDDTLDLVNLSIDRIQKMSAYDSMKFSEAMESLN